MTSDKIDKKPQTNKRFGIGEIYGQNFVGISNNERKELIDLEAKSRLDCPFLLSFPELAPNKKKNQFQCSKNSGVCSIRNFSENQNFGPLTATCPTRFYENGIVFREIGKYLLGDEDAKISKEIPFLESTVKKKNAAKGTLIKIVPFITPIFVVMVAASLNHFLTIRRTRSKDNAEIAQKIIGEGDIENAHDFLLEVQFQSLYKANIEAPVIRYLLEQPHPTKKLFQFSKG